MPTQPLKAIPPLEPNSVIDPHQVWSHLSPRQQHQIRQELITVIQQILPLLDRHSTLEEPSNDDE